MYMRYNLLRTGETAVLNKDRAPGFEFVEFEPLDAPVNIPSGSVIRLEGIRREVVVMPGVAWRGW